MLYLATTADTTAIKSLIDQWVAVGQALVGSIGALAFLIDDLSGTTVVGEIPW